MNFVKFLRTCNLKNTSEWLLLECVNQYYGNQSIYFSFEPLDLGFNMVTVPTLNIEQLKYFPYCIKNYN